MAKASEQFRQSDVTLWGIAALVSAGLAVFGSNISLLVPQSMLGGLHQPRVAGSSLESLRRQVSDLTEQSVQLKRENELLVTRFALQEKTGNETVRRVGALEVTIPRLLEDNPNPSLVDRSTYTSSIGANQTLTFDAEGGSVAVRQSPLPQANAGAASAEQPLPASLPEIETAAVAPAVATYGIAIGAPVPSDQTDALWNDLTLKLGPLLFGLTPLVVDQANSRYKHIVVGPINELSEARSLCERFERVSIACLPMPYAGTPL